MCQCNSDAKSKRVIDMNSVA
uniref:Uncharacterized protein n=1 Tax=Arundo donax TaxID=35708 RepID=A0A0A9EVD8_ARUDO